MSLKLLISLLPALWWLQAAAAAEPLPDPLSLQDALRLADNAHPDEALQQAGLMRRQAEVESVKAQQGFGALLDLYPRYTRFAREPERDLNNDSLARLTFHKQLTDFGRTRALLDAASAGVREREHLLIEAHLKRKLQVIRFYFAVLLADLKFHADDEEMTRLFTPYDRARQRAELGMESPVDVLRMETAFREALISRTHSDNERRLARTRLALALNRTDVLPTNLVKPKLGQLEREIPEYEEIAKTALEKNPALLAQREKVQAARLTVAAQRALRKPVLTGGVELTAWEQEVGSREDVQIGLQLRVPIYQGGIDKAAIAKAQADLEYQQAEFESTQLKLRNQLLELLQELETLKTARRTAKTRLQYRELAADEHRAKYELELQTTLGESIARLTEAEYLAMRDEFATVLAWTRLEALLGENTTMVALQK